jgi:hypothetical protein
MEARQFIKDVGLSATDHTFAVFDEIKDDQTKQATLFIHASVCGALLAPSISLCDELYNLGRDLSKTYKSLDYDIYRLDAMLPRYQASECARGDWPLDHGPLVESSALKALLIEAARPRSAS